MELGRSAALRRGGLLLFVDRIGDTRGKARTSPPRRSPTRSVYPGPGSGQRLAVQAASRHGRTADAAGHTFNPRTVLSTNRGACAALCGAAGSWRVCASADMSHAFKLRKVHLQRRLRPTAARHPLYIRNKPRQLPAVQRAAAGSQWPGAIRQRVTPMNAPTRARDGLRLPWPQPAAGEVQEVADSGLWLRMPLPFGLDHINLRASPREGLGGGRHRPGPSAAILGASRGYGRQPAGLAMCTHFHFDHSGLAAWLSPSASAARLYMVQVPGALRCPRQPRAGWELPRLLSPRRDWTRRSGRLAGPRHRGPRRRSAAQLSPLARRRLAEDRWPPLASGDQHAARARLPIEQGGPVADRSRWFCRITSAFWSVPTSPMPSATGLYSLRRCARAARGAGAARRTSRRPMASHSASTNYQTSRAPPRHAHGQAGAQPQPRSPLLFPRIKDSSTC
ncbi:hypothetical protein SSTU70S_00681 [Stutzerimonas stutzeri]